MRTILHIGAEKTGTTALQASFAESRNDLAAAGVCYPKTLWARQHFAMALYSLDDDRTTMLGERNALFSRSRPEYRAEVKNRLAKELSDDPNTLLLSSEIMAAQLARPSEIQRLKSLLDEWSDDYLVVLYMRRQDRATSSLYSTDLRTGSDSEDVLGPHPFTPIGFDYERILNLWTGVFGRSAVSPVVYEEAKEYERGILGSFTDCTGLSSQYFSQAPGGANSSLSAKAQELMLAYNKITGGEAATSRQEMIARNSLVHEVNRLYRGKPRRPSKSEATAYVQRFAESNSRIAHQWFGRDELFDDSFDEYPVDPDPRPDVEPHEVMEVARRLTLRLSEARLSS